MNLKISTLQHSTKKSCFSTYTFAIVKYFVNLLLPLCETIPQMSKFWHTKKLGFDFGTLRKVKLNTSPNIKLVNVLALAISWRNQVELGMGIMWRVMLILMIQGRTPGDDAMLTNKSMTIKIIVVGLPTNGWWFWRLEYPWSSWSPTTQVLLLVVRSRTTELLFVPIIIMA